MEKKLFKNKKERDIWIKLNAERIIDFNKNSIYSNKDNVPSMEEAMEISERQLLRDEEKGKLRYSLEELLTLDYLDLKKISDKNHMDFIKRFKDHY